MTTHHHSDVRLGANAEVHSVWFNTDENGIVQIEFQAVVGSRDNDTRAFISTEIKMSQAQAYELSKALENALALMAVSIESHDYLTREDLGLEEVSA